MIKPDGLASESRGYKTFANARKIVQLGYENAKKNLEDARAKNAVKLR
jgi:hypothetical protein